MDQAASGDVPSAAGRKMCSAVAAAWGAAVAAAFEVTVQEVEDYMCDPHGADRDASKPKPGPHAYPLGWDDKQPGDLAVVCYLDGPVPKGPPASVDGTVKPSFDRRLVIAADGVDAFMASAGHQHDMPLSPDPPSILLSRR